MLKWFRSSTAEQESAAAAREAKNRVRRHSSGLKEMLRNIRGEGLAVLDLGPTSAANISLLTERGLKVYTEDLLTACSDPSLQTKDEHGIQSLDVNRFLKDNLAYKGHIFDAVLFWDIADYLPEALVKPIIERLSSVMKPGGYLLAFFHTKDAGADSPYCRYHVAGEDALELQPVSIRQPNGKMGPARLLRIFNNRHIENLFYEFGSLKFFLARDNMREVLVVR